MAGTSQHLFPYSGKGWNTPFDLKLHSMMTQLDALIQRSVRISQRLAVCAPRRPAVTPPAARPSSPAFTPEPEPMQVDRYHLSQEERTRCRMHNLCLYCGESEHIISNCPVRPVCSSVSTIQPPASMPYGSFSVVLTWTGQQAGSSHRKKTVKTQDTRSSKPNTLLPVSRESGRHQHFCGP